MSAHTPGPWRVVVDPDRPHEPAIMVDEWYVATCHDNANDGDTLANARLIAAAPELLEAIHKMRDAMRKAYVDGFLDFGDGESPEYLSEAESFASAAIAKATGATP